jgi:hypothetical protein
MSFGTSSFAYAEVTTVQAPVCTIDQWGTTHVTYEPLQLVYASVTFPTVAYGTSHVHVVHLPYEVGRRAAE